MYRKFTTSLLVILLATLSMCAQEQVEKKKDFVKIGGAFRYNYINKSWNQGHKDKGGQASFDAMIFTAKGELRGVEFSVETRYYAESYGGFMLRNGYIGLPLSDNLKLKVGMPRTPFGIMPFTGNSFMFNMPYYMGFEDDADLGALLEYKCNNLEAQLNFAKNSEDIMGSKNKRYAYDISGDNQELNQLSTRVAYHFGDKKQHEIGGSAQYGQIYNTNTQKKGDKYVFALHGVFKFNRWDVKAEAIACEFNPKDTISTDFIKMGAFNGDYEVARKGFVYSLSVGYQIPLNYKFLDDIKFYNDFSAYEKSVSDYDSSYMNVLGCMLHTGPVYVLVDYVLANNHPWIGNNFNQGLSVGGEKSWNRRFNVNIGLYF